MRYRNLPDFSIISMSREWDQVEAVALNDETHSERPNGLLDLRRQRSVVVTS